MIEGILNQLVHSTLQIIVEKQDGSTSSGTSFLFLFENNFPCLITNKHVVNLYKKVSVRFTKADENQNPLLGQFIPCDITKCLERAIPHPDKTVDLVAIPLEPILRVIEENHLQAFMYFYSFDSIPNADDWKWICPGKDVLIVGYPFGLSDRKNNLPVVRKGVIATAPTLNFDKDHGFLVDTFSSKGSSGSPIIAMRYGNRVNLDTGEIKTFEDFRIIGINFRAYFFNNLVHLINDGKQSDQFVQIQENANLAIAVPSTDLKEINRIIVERFFPESHQN